MITKLYLYKTAIDALNKYSPTQKDARQLAAEIFLSRSSKLIHGLKLPLSQKKVCSNLII